MADHYDVIVIGAGPAGYVCAIRCAQLGLKTACVDNWVNKDNKPVLGGTCLNVGCIPSKVLLESSALYAKTINGAADHGVKAQKVELDVAAMMKRKDRIVGELTSGVESLFKANKLEWIQGKGTLLSRKNVRVISDDKETILEAENIVLAVGSKPVKLKAALAEKPFIVDSSGALEFTEVPKRLGIIGAGAIGLELGSVWSRLGSEVILLEAQDSFLTMADKKVADTAKRELMKQGLDIRLGARVINTEVSNNKVKVEYEDKNGSRQENFDRLIVTVGRQANTRDLADKEAQLTLDEWAFIHVNDQCATTLPGVWAIGDAVRGPMLAHKGSEEGVMVAELIAGNYGNVNYDTIPSVIYTHPEIAWVGKTEQALKTEKIEYKSGSSSFAASGRAKASGETSGFVKILADGSTDRLLGVHIIGPQASELIAQAVIAMEMGATSEDLAMTMFAHPALSEAIHEAALAVHGRAIHMINS